MKKMSNPKWIRLDGKEYLGTVDEKAKKVVGIRAGHDNGYMKEYLKAENIGTLAVVNYGDHSSVIVEEMTPAEVIQFDAYKATMALVKKSAVARLENGYFDAAF
jgi:hypothetical protein